MRKSGNECTNSGSRELLLMPDCRLRRTSPVLPGGFKYTLLLPGGKQKRIRDTSMQAATDELLSLRLGNKLPRATYTECEDDISVNTCQEHGCDPKYCTDGTKGSPGAVTPRQKSKGCGACGKKKVK